MIYSEAMRYIANVERGGSDYGIERMRLFLDALDKPDEKLKFVHVAGTNGKGSVCAYLTSVLIEAGYKVGTYNSPSVFEYNERWRINGEPLSDELVAKYITQVKEKIEAINEVGLIKANVIRKADELINAAGFNLTAFEIETAVAMLAFFEQNCDIVILETGLGGRWDATNAIRDKEVAVIAPIGLDHCALLGNTLGEIASEKAAIIKDDAVTCMQSDEVMKELSNPYGLVDCKKEFYPIRLRICNNPKPILHGLNGQLFEYADRQYKIGLLGKHQVQNAAIAICAVEVLREKGWKISEKASQVGLEKAKWRARLEIVNDSKERYNITVPDGKLLIFDGAHNPHGAKALAEAITDYFADKKVHIVMGMLADKDVDGVLQILAPLANKATAVTPNSPRALDKSALRAKVQKYVACDDADNIKSAVQNALLGVCDVIVLCGSLTLFSSLE